MAKNLATITQIINNPQYKYLNMTRAKILSLDKVGKITIIRGCDNLFHVSISQLETYIEEEIKFNNLYLSLSEFIEKVFLTKINFKYIEKGIIENISKLSIEIHTFNKKKYIKKADLQHFTEHYVHRNDVLEKLNIPQSIYEKLIIEKSITELFITKKHTFLHLKELSKLKDYFTIEKNVNDKWMAANNIIKNQQYIHLAKKTDTLLRIAQLGHLKWFINSTNTLFIEKDSLIKYADLVNELKRRYYPLTKITRMFGIKQFSISQLRNAFIPNLIKHCKSMNIKIKILSIPVEQQTIYIYKKGIDLFFEEFISNREIVEIYKIDYKSLALITNKYDIKSYPFHHGLSFYKKEDINNKFDNNDEIQIRSTENKIKNYYCLKEVLEILNSNNIQLNIIRKEEGLNYYYYNGTTFYLKKDIDEFKERQIEAANIYCTPYYIKSRIGNIHLTPFKRIKPSMLIKRALNSSGRVQSVYLLSEVEPYIRDKKIRVAVSQLDSLKPYQNFLCQLDIYNILFPSEGIYTKEKWFLFCKNKLEFSNGSRTIIGQLIPKLVKCTRHIIKLVRLKELFLINSYEINSTIFTNELPITHQNLLFEFIKVYHSKLKGDNLPSFQLSLIKNPYKKTLGKQSKEIYSFKEYKTLYEYANNVETHKAKAIEDALIEIKQYNVKNIKTKNNCNYAASWLFVLIHLNNAWRQEDITNLPNIDISFLGLKSLEEFSKRILTIEEANQIINQIIYQDLKTSKTSATNYFFCSEDLSVSLATAVIICIFNTNECCHQNNNIINFGNKYNTFSTKAHNGFFYKFKDDKFIFQNRKMNRTILTLTHTLLTKKGLGGAALEVAQRLRAHQDYETTNIYISIPVEELNNLTLQLFQRKQFGYISNLFADVIIGENSNREKRTNEIMILNQKFGGYFNIELTAGFINSMLAEKETIADMILNKGRENALELLYKIEAGLLPSKEDHIQCLIAESGCKNPATNCSTCIYSIPNFYSLSALTERVKNTLTNFKIKFENNIYNAEKVKLSNLLFKEIDLLQEACKAFGKESVFLFFENKQEGYFQLLSLIDGIEDDQDVTNYLTYNPEDY